jgi:RNA polymerase sigma-70 factor (sigma-E family)
MGFVRNSSGRRADDSFIAFVAARSGRLIAHAEMLCGNPDQARDVVQTVLMRAYPRWRRIERDDPYAYVSRAVTNAVTDWWRRSHRRHEHSTNELPEQVLDAPTTFEDREAVTQALALLTPRERAVVVLRYLEEMTEREVADTLGISLGTVKSTCHKALRKMRVRLDDDTALVGMPSEHAMHYASKGVL